MMSVVALMSIASNHQFGSSVTAFKPTLLSLRPNNRASVTAASIRRDTIANNNNNICAIGSNTRRVRCTTNPRDGLIGAGTGYGRGLPLAASSSSSEGNGAAKKKKRKTKAKSKVKRKTTAKAKSKTKTAAAAAAETIESEVVVVTEEKEVSPVAVQPEEVEVIKASAVVEEEIAAVVEDSDSSSSSDDGVYYGPRPKIPDTFQFDLTGGRPGTIIESESELKERDQIMAELEINDASKTGRKNYPKWLKNDYGFLQEDEDAEYDNNDPDAIDGSTLGQYDITDLNTKFDYDWNPETDDDPNLLETQLKDNTIPSANFVQETAKDEEGIEVGFDSLFGVSNPIDERTKIGTIDSYMVDVNTRDEQMLTPEFFPDDPEVAFNEDIVSV